MTLPGRRVPRCWACWALLTVVVCGLAIIVPSGALADGPCNGKDLRLAVHREEKNAANKSTTWVLAFKNTDHQCSLDGYPPTELLNGKKSLPTGLVTHKLGVLYGEVVLTHNKEAYTTFSLFHGPNCLDFKISSVEFLRAPDLRIHLPSNTTVCHVQVYPFRDKP